jgi:hypothetical protein
MARRSQDRENLLRDATALVPRVMLRMSILDESCEVFAGFRGEALSIYFNADPVYHFNSWCELRRAFVDGRIIKAECEQLFVWEPQRSADTVTMQSRAFSPVEQQEFGANLLERLAELRTALEQKNCELLGQVPAEGDAEIRLQSWLDQVTEFIVARTAKVK